VQETAALTDTAAAVRLGPPWPFSQTGARPHVFGNFPPHGRWHILFPHTLSYPV